MRGGPGALIFLARRECVSFFLFFLQMGIINLYLLCLSFREKVGRKVLAFLFGCFCEV